jgi:hypothetical protein
MSGRGLPPLLSERSRGEQVLLAAIVPALFGAITGFFLGVSGSAYTALSVFAAIGGVLAGFDHRGAAAGGKRGVISGSIFGAAVLIAHEVHGAEAEVHLPEPAIVLVAFTTLLGGLFGVLGGVIRERFSARAAS